jgi:hypothetical protein
MQLFIPPLSTKLKLSQDWTFKAYLETRNIYFFSEYFNKTVYDLTQQNQNMYSREASYLGDATLMKDTVLIVDRIYIRKGVDGFDSVTFRLHELSSHQQPTLKNKKGRFWVKLEDANKILCTPVVNAETD